MINIFNEILWGQYKNLPHIRTLTEAQQVKSYRQYLNELSSERIRYTNYINWLDGRSGGVKKEKGDDEEDVLLQENEFEVLLENGMEIKL